MVSLTVWFVLLWVDTSLGYILRLPCLTYGNFSIAIVDYRLTGHVLKTFNNLNVDECENECIEHGGCKSINTRHASGANCELNSKSTENPFDNVALTASSGWTYRSTDYMAKNFGYVCQTKDPCPAGHTCTDTCTCPGYQCQLIHPERPKNCQDLYKKGFKETGIYQIKIPGRNVFDVRCDMTIIGDAWTVLQRRGDAAVNFNRGWNEYKAGFGDLNGNFWLGLDKIHQLAAPGKGAILRVDIKHMDFDDLLYAEYSTFEITSEADGYRLNIGGYSGDAGDSLSYHNGRKFTTFDHYNSGDFLDFSFDLNTGGWWHIDNFDSNLNSLYPPDNQEYSDYISWWCKSYSYGKITISAMKIKY